jgi:hypothetical protein
MLAMPVADPSRRPTRLGSVSVASIFVIATLAACGSSGQTTTTTTTTTTAAPRTVPRIHGPSDLLVGNKEIKRVGEGSPYGALLRWWQTLQSKDVAAARAAYAKSVDTTAVGREIRQLSYPPGLDYRGSHPLPSVALQRSRPKRVSVSKHDGTVRVFAVINAAVFDKSHPNKVVFVSQTPTYFELEQVGAKWKLVNDDYLEQAVATRPRG